MQFYWAAAGVTSGNVTKFAHDNFLQMQDPELGWIRNVMRVAGTECDARRGAIRRACDFAIDEWIGDERTGQLGYFRRKVRTSGGRPETTSSSRAGHLGDRPGLRGADVRRRGLSGRSAEPAGIRDGLRPAAVGVRQSYAKGTAEAELIKQYEFMGRIFHNARRRIDAADERRRTAWHPLSPG